MAWVDALVKVKPGQFYGIEIEDFPCQVAQLSMLLMKHLMDREVGDYFGVNIIDFPIRENANIVRGNALRLDWNEVCPAERLCYIIGNPPFIGKKEQTPIQKQELFDLFVRNSRVGNLDYVVGWYKKAIDYMRANPKIHSAFVSTNSISQGEQTPIMQEYIFGEGININFAYQTFRWSNQAKGVAAVHCFIIGFSFCHGKKTIFLSNGSATEVKNINTYLIDADEVIISKRSYPISKSLPMSYGSMPIDNGALILSPEEKALLLEEDPRNIEYIKKYIGGNEFLNNDERYCIWLGGVCECISMYIMPARSSCSQAERWQETVWRVSHNARRFYDTT